MEENLADILRQMVFALLCKIGLIAIIPALMYVVLHVEIMYFIIKHYLLVPKCYVPKTLNVSRAFA